MKTLSIVIGLVLVLSGSGLAVIYAKYHSRLLFIEIQKAEQELDRLEVRWERLTIEERMLADHNQVEKKARNAMGLVELDRGAIIYIKL